MNHTEEITNILIQKWTKALEKAEEAAKNTNIPVSEAFENGYATAARGILYDLQMLNNINHD